MGRVKVLHATVGAVALLAAIAVSSEAFAGGYAYGGYRGGYRGGYHGGYHGYYGPRVGVGVVVGAPLWGAGWYGSYPYYGYGYPYAYPYPYPYPYYPYAPAVPVPASPPVYIEQGGAAPALAQPQYQQAPQQTQYWYYCPVSKAYYPYVKECADGWQQVPAQPPS